MATLISPGVSVTVTDESFYIPAQATTVPLILLATAEDKRQPNGTSVALGTLEHSVIRTVTSLTQSTQLYGIPRFLQSVSGDALHGDSRNEYGLFALNQYLGVGNRAYVVRANVNLNDDRDAIVEMWTDRIADAGDELAAAATAYITEYNTANGYVSGNPLFKTTLTRAELLALVTEVMAPIYESYNFNKTSFKNYFINDASSTPLEVYNSSFSAVVGSFFGVTGEAINWETNELGSVVGHEDEWTPAEADAFLQDCADDFSFTIEFLNTTALGSNDAARRAAIVAALQAAANLPELRAEAFEFTLVLAPGYHELADELVALVTDVNNEAIAIGDVPMNMDPDALVTWAESSSRIFSNSIAYYYAHGLASNLDGVDVLAASSGIALRTITTSDNNSYVWFAPAGANRGVVTGVSRMGYYTGTPGAATSFIESVLNVGQRDNLYKDGTNVNPITFMPGRGILIMGQKTSASVTSALDRINVVRLLAYMRRALRKSTFAFVFEPNDSLTRANLKAMVDGFLSNLVVLRGLYDYASQCDEINNTPDRIDRSELWCDIAIKPVKAAEFVYIPIRVVATGADI